MFRMLSLAFSGFLPFVSARLVCVNTFPLDHQLPLEYLLKQSLLPADLFKRICLAIYTHTSRCIFICRIFVTNLFRSVSMAIWQAIQQP